MGTPLRPAEFIDVRYLQKLFQKHMANYEPADPLYEEYIDSKGRTRRRKVR